MATTIYTYLHNDDLNGSRIVSKDDCMCMLYNIKRDDSSFLKDFNDRLQQPALYVLLNQDTHKAYIGETDDFVKRIVHHLQKKNFWKEVLVFLGSNEDTISKTEVQYLEYLAYAKALEINTYDLSENTQSPKKPHMNVMQKAKTDKFFQYVQFLTKFIGCDIFEKRQNIAFKYPAGEFPSTVNPVPIRFTSEELKGRTKLSLNGEGRYSKREMVLRIVKEYVRQYPGATYDELRATFKRDYLGRFAQYEFLQDDIKTARKWSENGEDHVHYFIDNQDLLVSADGIQFAVCVEWDKNNIINVLGIAQALGWTFDIVK